MPSALMTESRHHEITTREGVVSGVRRRRDERPLRFTTVRRTALQPVMADLVDQWGLESFPASDPPANW